MYKRKKPRQDHVIVYRGKYIVRSGTFTQMQHQWEKIPPQYQDEYVVKHRNRCQDVIDTLKVEVKYAPKTGSGHIKTA